MKKTFVKYKGEAKEREKGGLQITGRRGGGGDNTDDSWGLYLNIIWDTNQKHR